MKKEDTRILENPAVNSETAVTPQRIALLARKTVYFAICSRIPNTCCSCTGHLYLRDREKEVVDIMMTLFDQEYAVERYGDEREAAGMAQGVEQGEMKAKKETALTLAGMGMPAEKIAEAVKVSQKMVQEWLSGSVSLAR